jgi:signal transduction histidine kinase
MRAGRSPLRVVVADGASDVRVLLRVALGRLSDLLVVAEADGARTAVEAAREHQPDAFLIDLGMPDGMRALAEIAEAAPKTKILATSGAPRGEDEDEAVRAGAHAYLAKGGSVAQLAGTLRAICDRPAWPDEGRSAPSARATDAIPQEILSALAHELSSPVAVIHGFAETLKRHGENVSAAERAQFIDAILRGAAQVSALVSAFGDVRGIDTDAIDLAPEAADIGKLTHQIVNDMRQVLADHPIECEAADGVVAPVDPVRFRQVVTNLLSNAAKFSPLGAPVSARVLRNGDTASVWVQDRGNGIPVEARDRLFRKFSRLPHHHGVSGMGLGLYISRGIARAHGGDLVYEEAPGGGSRFVLTLPL